MCGKYFALNKIASVLWIRHTSSHVLTYFVFGKHTFTGNNLLQLDNMGIVKSLQNLDFPQCSNRKPIFFLFGVNALQRNYILRYLDP